MPTRPNFKTRPAATPGSGITTMADLVKKTKAAPGRLNYASAGSGGTHHLSGEMFKSQASTIQKWGRIVKASGATVE